MRKLSPPNSTLEPLRVLPSYFRDVGSTFLTELCQRDSDDDDAPDDECAPDINYSSGVDYAGDIDYASDVDSAPADQPDS